MQVADMFQSKHPTVFEVERAHVPIGVKTMPSELSFSWRSSEAADAPDLVFLVHAQDFLSSWTHYFPPEKNDEATTHHWWAYLFWPLAAFFHLIGSLFIKPLALKPFAVLDK